MKANQTSILMYGHDEHLLATRQWVLQSRGYRVLTMVSLSGFWAIPVTPPIRLLLLCHSLTSQECRDAMAAACERWPGIQSLVLDFDGSRAPSGLLGQLLHTMDGPAKLIATVGQLIGSGMHVAADPRV